MWIQASFFRVCSTLCLLIIESLYILLKFSHYEKPTPTTKMRQTTKAESVMSHSRVAESWEGWAEKQKNSSCSMKLKTTKHTASSSVHTMEKNLIFFPPILSHISLFQTWDETNDEENQDDYIRSSNPKAWWDQQPWLRMRIKWRRIRITMNKKKTRGKEKFRIPSSFFCASQFLSHNYFRKTERKMRRFHNGAAELAKKKEWALEKYRRRRRKKKFEGI